MIRLLLKKVQESICSSTLVSKDIIMLKLLFLISEQRRCHFRFKLCFYFPEYDVTKFCILFIICFFLYFQNLCDPISYKPMLHVDHGSDLRHFRKKSKSWTAGEKQKKSTKRSMSRLNLAF